MTRKQSFFNNKVYDEKMSSTRIEPLECFCGRELFVLVSIIACRSSGDCFQLRKFLSMWLDHKVI